MPLGKNKNILKYGNLIRVTKKSQMTIKNKSNNKTVIGVIGVLLTIFGIIGSISVLQNRGYLWMIITGMSVIAGVILVAWSLSN